MLECDCRSCGEIVYLDYSHVQISVIESLCVYISGAAQTECGGPASQSHTLSAVSLFRRPAALWFRTA